MQSAPSRLRAAVATAAAVSLTVVAVVPAAAHDDPGATPTPGSSEAAAQEHAAQDLAGVPMDKIEAAAKARQNELTKQTGQRPGRRAPQAQAYADRVAAAADPAVSGAWGSVFATPVVPVFAAMLPNGKILMWDSVGDGPAESYDEHAYTRAGVWDPMLRTFKRIDVKGYNIFCAGYAQLSDGTVLVAGGNRNKALNGLRQTHLFDWRTETWRRGPDMAAERWYPSVTALPNQEALILGGGPENAEVYQRNQWIRLLTGFVTTSSRLYPLLTVRPDGYVDKLGTEPTMLKLQTSGAGKELARSTRDAINRDYASFATFGIGKTLVAGGGIITEDGKQKVPTRTAVVVNSNTTPSQATATGSMALARRQFNLTVLADGNVLATGGESSAANNSTVDLANPVYAAELYNTATGTWRSLAAARAVRQYHSTAILLPDGRVMTGGGGICAECQRVGYLEKNVEYFYPPYWYNANGSTAVKPVVSSAPASAAYNANFTISKAATSQFTRFGLVGLGAPTHGDDQGQRYVPLTVMARNGNNITLKSPANVNQAPPGYYMLIGVNAQGTPSMAKFIRLTATAPAAPAPARLTVSGPGSRCMDVDHGSTTPGATIQLWDCNGTAPQRWTHPADGTFRALGVCATVPYGWVQAGVRLRTGTCNGADTSQKWQVWADGTIRSAKNTKICLSAPGKDKAEPVMLATCNGSATQKFRY
jgi:ricin-type beta-trefoil lectin protein/galactose oxidase-like protein